jgi:hypothetical protein
VLTLRAAAQLLTQADSRQSLRPIAHAMGFTATPTPLSADGRDRLHLDALASSADFIRGTGTLRLLCAEPGIEGIEPIGALRDERVPSTASLDAIAALGALCSAASSRWYCA